MFFLLVFVFLKEGVFNDFSFFPGVPVDQNQNYWKNTNLLQRWKKPPGKLHCEFHAKCLKLGQFYAKWGQSADLHILVFYIRDY